jgi:hypothetical protein
MDITGAEDEVRMLLSSVGMKTDLLNQNRFRNVPPGMPTEFPF